MSRLTRWLRSRQQRDQIDYMEALKVVHATIRPTNYLEIGVQAGHSLALSQVPSIGIDPELRISASLTAPVRLFEMTSDRFFADAALDQPVDFAFIDGMHLVEFVLRDFMNVEARSHARTVVAMDDVLPADIAYTPRERVPGSWTGDVYRIIPLLRKYRPDLEVRVYDVHGKGLGIVTRLDPLSRTLPDMYERIAADLSAGQFVETDAKAIRKTLRPRPTRRLASDLAAFRGHSVAPR